MTLITLIYIFNDITHILFIILYLNQSPLHINMGVSVVEMTKYYCYCHIISVTLNLRLDNRDNYQHTTLFKLQ